MAAEVRDLTVHIDTSRWSETVLEGVNLSVPDGMVTALLGESGCGKSMLAAALTGTLPESASRSGQVIVDGGDRENRRLDEVGYLPQDGVTAFDRDISVGVRLRDLERRYGRWTVEEASAAALYPSDVTELYPHQHSGGQIQRAALAAALLPAPNLLVVDEPTGSLDMGTAVRVWESLRRYADAGAAVLAITHDVHLLTATGAADRMSIMRAGRIVAEGTADEVSATEDAYVQGFFRKFGR